MPKQSKQSIIALVALISVPILVIVGLYFFAQSRMTAEEKAELQQAK